MTPLAISCWGLLTESLFAADMLLQTGRQRIRWWAWLAEYLLVMSGAVCL